MVIVKKCRLLCLGPLLFGRSRFLVLCFAQSQRRSTLQTLAAVGGNTAVQSLCSVQKKHKAVSINSLPTHCLATLHCLRFRG